MGGGHSSYLCTPFLSISSHAGGYYMPQQGYAGHYQQPNVVYAQQQPKSQGILSSNTGKMAAGMLLLFLYNSTAQLLDQFSTFYFLV